MVHLQIVAIDVDIDTQQAFAVCGVDNKCHHFLCQFKVTLVAEILNYSGAFRNDIRLVVPIAHLQI